MWSLLGVVDSTTLPAVVSEPSWQVIGGLIAIIGFLVRHIFAQKKKNGHDRGPTPAEIQDEIELAEELGKTQATIDAVKERVEAGFAETVRIRSSNTKLQDDIRDALANIRRA